MDYKKIFFYSQYDWQKLSFAFILTMPLFAYKFMQELVGKFSTVSAVSTRVQVEVKKYHKLRNKTINVYLTSQKSPKMFIRRKGKLVDEKVVNVPKRFPKRFSSILHGLF